MLQVLTSLGSNLSPPPCIAYAFVPRSKTPLPQCHKAFLHSSPGFAVSVLTCEPVMQFAFPLTRGVAAQLHSLVWVSLVSTVENYRSSFWGSDTPWSPKCSGPGESEQFSRKENFPCVSYREWLHGRCCVLRKQTNSPPLEQCLQIPGPQRRKWKITHQGPILLRQQPWWLRPPEGTAETGIQREHIKWPLGFTW